MLAHADDGTATAALVVDLAAMHVHGAKFVVLTPSEPENL